MSFFTVLDSFSEVLLYFIIPYMNILPFCAIPLWLKRLSKIMEGGLLTPPLKKLIL
jgi:hypothetical protein